MRRTTNYAAIFYGTSRSRECTNVLTLKQLALACVGAVVIEVPCPPNVLILAEALVQIVGLGRIVFVGRRSVVVTRGHNPLTLRVAWLCHIDGLVQFGKHGLHARPFESL